MTSSIDDEWWLSEDVSEPDSYVPPKYFASSSAEYNHNLFGNLRNNEFDASGGEWAEDLFAIIAISLGIGFIVVFFFPLISFCYPKNFNWFYKRLKRIGGRACSIFFLALCILVSIALFALIVHRYVLLKIEFKNIQENFREGSYLLNQIQDNKNQGLYRIESMISTLNTEKLNVETCLSGLELSDIDDLITNINHYVENIDNEDLNNDLEDAIEKSKDISAVIYEKYSLYFFIAYASAICICVFGRVFMISTEKKSGETSCQILMKKLLNFLVAFLVLSLSWFFLTSSTTGAMIFGDFCQDPQSNSLDIYDDNQFVDYYTTCEGTNIVQNAAMIGNIVLKSLMQTINQSIDSFNTLNDECSPTLLTAKNKINAEAFSVYELLNEVVENTKCEKINSLYVDAVHESLCTDINRSLDILMADLLLFNVFIVLAIVFYKLYASHSIPNPNETFIQRRIEIRNSISKKKASVTTG
eukprot:CAMPEP_0171484256 /NCGR_PEP_ID=MMETSP0946-20130122/8706_1 /TAXON_ID=109269 /ORGANISM="Vaucheria litorea, Strain CCMP2940" /LENGTH=471 /DNA_ID=CAMNT_0012016931 /DNA_START=44 /DNA_END=1455 /DNA_ORIENTATION=-